MRSIERLLQQYGESHQNKTNVLIHAIAVPDVFKHTPNFNESTKEAIYMNLQNTSQYYSQMLHLIVENAVGVEPIAA